MNMAGSIVDGSLAVAGLVAGLMALVWTLRLHESSTEVRESNARGEDRTTLNKAA